MSTTNLPPPPLLAPLIDRNGFVTRAWAEFITQAFVRMGGATATPNDQIVLPPWTTAQITAKAITAALLGSDVAGSGLTGGNGAALAANPDGSTLDISGGALEVKAGGIGGTQLASGAVSAAAKVADGILNFAKLLGTDWTSSFNNSGYQKFGPGLYLQWGVTGTLNGNTTNTISFPTTFPNACYQVLCNMRDISGLSTSTTGQIGTGNYSTSSFDLYNRTNVNEVFNWMAVGH